MLRRYAVHAASMTVTYKVGTFVATGHSDALYQAREKLRRQGNVDMLGWRLWVNEDDLEVES